MELKTHDKIVLKIAKEEGDFNYWIEKAEKSSHYNIGINLRVFLKEMGYKQIPKGTKEVLNFIKISENLK